MMGTDEAYERCLSDQAAEKALDRAVRAEQMGQSLSAKCEWLAAECNRLAAEVVALREALEEYGEHNSGCDPYWTRVPCRCGLDLILYANPSPAVAEVLRLVELGRKAQDA